MVKKLKLRENVNNLESFLDTVIDDVTVHCNGKELETYIENLLLDIVESRFNDSIFYEVENYANTLMIILSNEIGSMDFEFSIIYDMLKYRLSIQVISTYQKSAGVDSRNSNYNDIIPITNLSDISTALYNMLDYFVSGI